MVDFYEYSTPELVRLLGNRFKESLIPQHYYKIFFLST